MLIYVNDLYPHTFQIENYRDIIQTTKDKEARMRGGAREGAGRRSEGRKYYKIRLSEAEYRMIALMGGSKWIQDHIKQIEEKAMTTTIDTTKFTEEEQDLFIEGWKDAGGYVGDLEAGVDCPWCCPWDWCETIKVTGTDIKDWGRQHWEDCREEVERLLKEDEERAKEMAEEEE